MFPCEMLEKKLNYVEFLSSLLGISSSSISIVVVVEVVVVVVVVVVVKLYSSKVVY